MEIVAKNKGIEECSRVMGTMAVEHCKRLCIKVDVMLKKGMAQYMVLSTRPLEQAGILHWLLNDEETIKSYKRNYGVKEIEVVK